MNEWMNGGSYSSGRSGALSCCPGRSTWMNIDRSLTSVMNGWSTNLQNSASVSWSMIKHQWTYKCIRNWSRDGHERERRTYGLSPCRERSRKPLWSMHDAVDPVWILGIVQFIQFWLLVAIINHSAVPQIEASKMQSTWNRIEGIYWFGN